MSAASDAQARPREVTQVHTRLLSTTLETEDARAYWARAPLEPHANAQRAFDDYWFGARSLARVEVLLAVMRARFDAFPPALTVLHQWQHMAPPTRQLICHWHLQLADPLYRRFTGEHLVARRLSGRDTITRDHVVRWVIQHGASRWGTATQLQFASKLMSASLSAGLLGSNRDPRPLTTPRVPDDALDYLMHLLREVQFEGTLLENPYLASVGLDNFTLDDKLRGLSSMAFKRQGELVELGWRHATMADWADAHHPTAPRDAETL